jgi:phenylalanyl-tRNA synthetase beta chain
VAPRPRRSSVFRPGRADALLGVPVPAEESQRILAGLGFTMRESVEGISVEIPSWRGDASREADLIEEVGRHYGLDKIPSTVPPGRGAEGLRPWQQRLRAVRDALAGAGLVEVITYAFVNDRAADGHVPPRTALRNPLSDEQGVLRTSLVVPADRRVPGTPPRRRDAHLRVGGCSCRSRPLAGSEVQRLGC